MARVIYAHIDLTPEGMPYIAGTQTKVVEVVSDRLAYHSLFIHPCHTSSA